LGSSNGSWPPSASIGENVGGDSISGTSCALARKISQSVRVFTRWYSCPRYRWPWSLKLSFLSVRSTVSYVPLSKMRTEPAP
jgi:hypothetical protein